MQVIMIALGGALGAIIRYSILGLFSSLEHRHIFLGVLIVNSLGSLIVGIMLGLLATQVITKHQYIYYFIATGFLGALTTFSTFSQDNFKLLLSHNIGGFLRNITLNIGICLLMTAIGYFTIIKFLK